jgi:isopenicillin N synthase-like dioxygenase
MSLERLRGSDGDRRSLADELTAVYHDIGFAVLVDHGLPEGLLGAVFDMMGSFFALPDEQKRLIDKSTSPYFRGWESVGTEFTNNRPDIREQIDVWSEHPPTDQVDGPDYLKLLGPNQWMPDDVLPGQQKLALDWFEQLGTLADEVLSLFAVGLGLAPDHFAAAFGDDAMSLTKFINYPATPDGAAGVNAHNDTGFVTLLATGETPGLQVLDPTGAWIDVPVVPNSFVLNIGEMLQAMSGNYLMATAHRVITSEPRRTSTVRHSARPSIPSGSTSDSSMRSPRASGTGRQDSWRPRSKPKQASATLRVRRTPTPTATSSGTTSRVAIRT